MSWWVHQDSNLGPAGYEPVALTAELWTLRIGDSTSILLNRRRPMEKSIPPSLFLKRNGARQMPGPDLSIRTTDEEVT